MKSLKLWSFILSMLMLGMLGACSEGGSGETEKLRQEKEELLAKIRKDSLYIAGLNSEMDELYANLDTMRAREERIRQAAARMKSGSMSGREGSLTIDQSFAELDRLNKENQAKIAQLQSKLSQSGKENALLQKMVDELQKSIQDKEMQIRDLQSTIAALQDEITGLKSQYAAKAEEQERTQTALVETQAELYSVFYAIGTRKELENRGVIDAKGLFNRNKDLNSDIDESRFTKLDSRTATEIQIGNYKAKRVELVPARSASSYQLVESGSNLTLKITDPRSFWKTKFVAIVVR
ncbi:Cbp1 family collagen-binding glycoprotein adhesin [Rhodoflexus sp.]